MKASEIAEMLRMSGMFFYRAQQNLIDIGPFQNAGPLRYYENPQITLFSGKVRLGENLVVQDDS